MMWAIPNKYIAAIVVSFTIAELAFVLGVHLGYGTFYPESEIASVIAVGTVQIRLLPPTTLTTEFSKYSPNTTVRINGTSFTENGNVSLNITNSTGQVVSGFPITLVADSNGKINTTWSISSNNTDNYTISGQDIDNSLLNAATTVEVLFPYSFTNIGIVDISNNTINTSFSIYVNGNLVFISNNTFNFTFDYGTPYTIVILPDISVCVGINLTISNIGGLVGDIVRIDRPPADSANKTPPVDEICPFDIPVNFTSITFTMAHAPVVDSAIYKCIPWNLSARRCVDGNWTLLQVIANGATHTTVSDLKPGDPALAIGTTCRDGSCNGVESCVSCPSDCTSCPEVAEAITRFAVGSQYNPCTRQIKKIAVDLDTVNIYSILMNSCDDVKVRYNNVQYPFNIRMYLSAVNSLRTELAGKLFVLKLGEPVRVDLDKDGKADVNIVLTSLGFDSRIEFTRIQAAPEIEVIPAPVPEVREPTFLGVYLPPTKDIVALLITVFVTGTVIAFVFYWRRHSKETLASHIHSELQRGRSEREIVRKLSQEGWTDEAIAHALGKAITRRRR